MAIPIRDEQICSLADVAGRVRKHINTVRNWAKGMKDGRQLETELLGGSVITSWEALARFQVSRGGKVHAARATRERKQSTAALRHLQEVHGIGFNA